MQGQAPTFPIPPALNNQYPQNPMFSGNPFYNPFMGLGSGGLFNSPQAQA